MATGAGTRSLGAGSRRTCTGVPGLESLPCDGNRGGPVRRLARRRTDRVTRLGPPARRSAASGDADTRALPPPGGGARRTAPLRDRRTALGDVRSAGVGRAPDG